MSELVSVGVFAYNEEATIGPLLDVLRSQRTKEVTITEIVVVSSACRDRTDEIVRRHADEDERVRLIVESERRGKAHAINRFLERATSRIVVLTSADVVPEERTIEHLCRPLLEDSRIGMTGAHPIPINDSRTMLGYLIHFWWYAHYHLPRLGEMIAYRRALAPQIDSAISCDEAWIEARVDQQHYRTVNVDNALVHNRGAETFRELLAQRRRIYAGLVVLRRLTSYPVKSFRPGRTLRLVWDYWRRDPGLAHGVWLACGAAIETYARCMGLVDVHLKKRTYTTWERIDSTKKGLGNMGQHISRPEGG